MAARDWVLGGVLLAGAIAVALWLSHADAEAPTLSTLGADTAAPTAPADASTVANAADVVKAAGAAAPERLAAPVAASLEASRNAILRGRCVDVAGAPRAGCVVSLRGWGADQARVDAWLIEHAAQPEWTDPPAQTTTDDGTFAFTFWPPPPWQFELDVLADGCGAMSGSWSKLDEGLTTELGDIAMTPGVRVTGRVVDEQGQPQAKQYISFAMARPTRSDDARAPVQPGWGDITITRDDGTFTSRGWLVPGPYQLNCPDRRLEHPAALELAAERPLEDVTIVLKTLVDVPAITGRVVDEANQPVPEAQVEHQAELPERSASVHTSREGTFALRRRENDNGPTARLVVSVAGYECEPEPKLVPWGSSDVEFRVVRGSTLTLRVTDRRDAPVTTYTVRMTPRNRSRWVPHDARVRTQGHHDNGTATIDGLTRGDWLVIVDFPTASGFDALFQPLQVTAIAPMRLDLRAGVELRRGLRVVNLDDTPVVGTQVQLCELFGRALDANRMVMRRDLLLMNPGGRSALVLFEGKTDDEGRIELRGPGDRELGLCLLGPGHVPQMQGGVYLAAEGELVVRVSRGARLEGRIVPPEALAELRRLARLGPTDPFPANRRLQLSLRSPTGSFPNNVRVVDEAALASLYFADDGSVAATGLPPGAWHVEVRGWEFFESHGHSQVFPANQVVLVDGEATRVDLDLQSILPGTLEGVVLWNDAPLADTDLSFTSSSAGMNVRTDAAGRFTKTCRPGEYSLRMQPKGWTGGLGEMLRSPTRALVVRGETTRQTFTVASGKLQLTVLDDGGQPVPQIQVMTRPDADYLPPTDASGKVTAELTAQNATLQVLPKRLASPEAQQKFLQEARPTGNENPLAPHWITVGTVSIEQGQTHELVLRLPKAWRE